MTQARRVDPAGAGTLRRDAQGKAPTTRTRMILVAERLFAERGIEAVSVSEILELSGQRNKSAVQYHFGDRDGLVLAIAEHRSQRLNHRRTELLADLRSQGRTSDVRELSKVLVLPLAELLEEPDNHYLGFLARYHLDRSRRQLVAAVDPQLIHSYREAASLLQRACAIPRREFDIRFGLCLDMVFTALAGRQADEQQDRRIHPGTSRTSRMAFVDHLVTCVAGALALPSRPLPPEGGC